MKASWAVPAAVVLFGIGRPAVAADDPARALERKLVGAWIGQSACAGKLVFQADGTYHYGEYGPVGGQYEVGTWTVDWAELPPTLVMTPLPADGAEAEPVRKVRLVQLTDRRLDFRHPPTYTQRPEEHRRGTPADDLALRLRVLDRAVQRYLGTDRLGGGVTLPPDLKALVDKKLLRPESLLDPWGKPFQYDAAGKRNKGKRPDVWTVVLGTNEVVGNWAGRE